jgi:hypothetical protein
LVGHVDGHYCRPATVGIDAIGELCQPVGAPGSDHHVMSVAGEPGCGGLTDSAARASDHDDLV